VDYGEHRAAVERELDDFVRAVAAGPTDAPVPTCPGWGVAALVDHVGGFTGFWTHVLCEGTGRPLTPFPARPPGEAMAGWFADVGSQLVQELAATPADQPVWTWHPDHQDAAFVARRAAHELAVHRFDAQAARGWPRPIDAALAADGIEEIFMMIDAFAARGDDTGRGDGERLVLHATDHGAAWLIRLTPRGLQVERGAAPGDLTLSGRVSDLELVLYGRPAIDHVERVGDPTVLDAWYRAFRFG